MVQFSLIVSANNVRLNVPGKRREVLCYSGGLPTYRKELEDSITPGWRGFTVQ